MTIKLSNGLFSEFSRRLMANEVLGSTCDSRSNQSYLNTDDDDHILISVKAICDLQKSRRFKSRTLQLFHSMIEHNPSHNLEIKAHIFSFAMRVIFDQTSDLLISSSSEQNNPIKNSSDTRTVSPFNDDYLILMIILFLQNFVLAQNLGQILISQFSSNLVVLSDPQTSTFPALVSIFHSLAHLTNFEFSIGRLGKSTDSSSSPTIDILQVKVFYFSRCPNFLFHQVLSDGLHRFIKLSWDNYDGAQNDQIVQLLSSHVMSQIIHGCQGCPLDLRELSNLCVRPIWFCSYC